MIFPVKTQSCGILVFTFYIKTQNLRLALAAKDIYKLLLLLILCRN